MSKSNRLLLVLVAGLGCGGPVEPPPEGTLRILVPSTELRPGRTIQAAVRIEALDGTERDPVEVRWESLTPVTVAVDSAGRLTALAPGDGRVRARAGALTAELSLTLRNPPVHTVTLGPDTVRLVVPGGTRQLLPVARDSLGEPILGATIQWSTSAARIAAVTVQGQITAVAAGQARVTAQSGAALATVEVEVGTAPAPTAPIITGVVPTVLLPGQSVTLTGGQFIGVPGGNAALLDGVPLVVTQASPTQVTLTLPPATSFPCLPRRSVQLQVATSGGITAVPVLLEVASRRELARGAHVVLPAGSAHCLDLATPGRYLLGVVNVARSLGTPPVTVTLTGVGPVADPRVAMRSEGDREAPLPGAAGHLALLATNRSVLSGTAPLPARRLGSASLVEPRVGDLRAMRVPALGTAELCTRFTPVTARVVWVGRRITMLEDTSTVVEGERTLAGTQDASYAAVGAELDSLGWGIARTFGDPLIMDSRLDDDGRVAVLLTPRMNLASGGGALAATVTCDLFPRVQFPASNMGEVIYAQVPTSAQGGEGPGTPGWWRREMRGTLVHELKHVLSYAERVIRRQPLEEPWLEEAMARQAEELFGRAVFGYRRGANVGFAASLACEVDLVGCPGRPRVMFPHIEGLSAYLRSPASRSPLGPVTADDGSYYGSAWAFTRWALDQQGSEESATFAALVTSGQSGLANLEARIQRPWEELLPEWVVAMVADDRGLPVAARVTFPSWDLRDLFRGLCDVVGQCRDGDGDPRFASADPVVPMRLVPLAASSAGAAPPPTLLVGPIVAGGFAPLALDAWGPAVLGLSASGAATTTIRLALLRID